MNNVNKKTHTVEKDNAILHRQIELKAENLKNTKLVEYINDLIKNDLAYFKLLLNKKYIISIDVGEVNSILNYL